MTGLGGHDLDWTGPNWTGVGRTGMDWAGSIWHELDWSGLHLTGLRWTGLNCLLRMLFRSVGIELHSRVERMFSLGGSVYLKKSINILIMLGCAFAPP